MDVLHIVWGVHYRQDMVIRDFFGFVCRLDASLILGIGISVLRLEDLLEVAPLCG